MLNASMDLVAQFLFIFQTIESDICTPRETNHFVPHGYEIIRKAEVHL